MFVYYVDQSYTTIISCKKVKSVKRWGDQVKQTNYITEWSMPNRIVVYYDDCGWDCIHEKPAIMCRRKFWLEEYNIERAKEIVNDYVTKKKGSARMKNKCEYVDAIVRVRIPKYQLTAGENVSVCFPDAMSVHGKIEEASKKEDK